MKDYSDEELMNSVVDDDDCAFEELFHRYKRRLFNFFYALDLNVEEAQDCVQETFLKLWQNRMQFVNRGRFSSYMFQIAKNHFLDRKRNQKSHMGPQRIAINNQTESLPLVSLSGNGYARTILKEIRDAVSDAMSHLPETQRIVYVLSEEQRLSYKEIADILECPVGTVSSRKVEAVKKLRTLLQPLRDELFIRKSPPKESGVFNNNNEVKK